ncbi:SDR family oxidoreductase [Halomonas beimenensis]|uniref:Oxidoreductase, short-chain dehydrogenase/reductase family n=1 Tax=Halomonas beimenensis TaxID=475662 RepID=A0A291PCH0_9GAMM|nr:SDR family oxidoreductase [Halomonas beimenensis]ATJ84541.1 oxidoreductase, short-chain dehydrogenase/reductase family [Halomonas beimenensis]
MRWPDRDRLRGGWSTQCVLLTGASGGIGRALVDELAGAGARLVITGRRREPLEALCRRHGASVTAQPADLTRAEDRHRLAMAAERQGCTMLINAAGVNWAGSFEACDDTTLERLVTTNLTATLQLTHALLPQLRRAERGRLVNLGSAFGEIGYPGQAGYCATKFALRGFSQALRRELADTPVRVLYIAPRATRTAMNAPAMEALNEALGNAMDPPEAVARQVRRAIERGRKETRLGGAEPFLARLNALAPGLVDAALRRQLPTVRRFIAPKGGNAP